MGRSLVIVESPAKVKTINNYLGKGYVIKASMGHVCDLPEKKLGVNIKNDFQPTYQVIPGKKKLVVELKKSARETDRVILAADPDREGEAISWHLSQLLKEDNPNIFRAVFNEITPEAIRQAFEMPGSLDQKKIDAQQARRILDRLVGYLISPLLWKKIGKGLSAGRVQSVALRLICDREKEIKAFVSEEYWSITAFLKASNPPEFKASLVKIDGKKVKIKDEIQARKIVSDCEQSTFVLEKIKVEEKRKNPLPPYVTSSLQQDAFRWLRFTVKKTMSLAQRLYEGLAVGEMGQTGLITYMRTDSVRVSDQAKAAARSFIIEKFSEAYLPARPFQYKNKKKTQDAHEAIRPTHLNLTPEKIKPYLKKEEYDLYRLIWNRFLASQMAPAVIEETEFTIKAAPAIEGESSSMLYKGEAEKSEKSPGPIYTFRAKGEVVKFDGFLVLFPEAKAAEQSGGEARETEGEPPTEVVNGLPKAEPGEMLRLISLDSKQNFTQPPPRYTEGTLVRELESKGIGRPSTYAPIISTLQDRTYVIKEKGKFKPTALGLYVTDFLVKHFSNLMAYEFTARMEEELDQIAEGDRNWVESLRQFYSFFEQYLKKGHESESVKQNGIPLEEKCPKCGRELVIKSGRFGRFKSCSGYPECKYRGSLVRKETKVLEEKCPDCQATLVQRYGKFGPFVACSNYPKCRFIKKENSETGVLCPLNCGGQVLRRKSKRGKIFYGCANYPECKYVSWDEPLQRDCPKCGSKILYRKVFKGDAEQIYCKNDKCDFEESKDSLKNEQTGSQDTKLTSEVPGPDETRNS